MLPLFFLCITALVRQSCSAILQVADHLPGSAVPYLIRHLDGPKLLLADDAFRILTNSDTTKRESKNIVAGGFSILDTNGKPNGIVPPHYHVHWHETFVPINGQLRVWLNGEARDLGAGDFAMVPSYTKHSYQIVAPETEFLGLIQPAGFEEFFINISAQWNPKFNVPYPPDQALPFPGESFQAVASKFDIQVTHMATDLPRNDPQWHESNSSLPANSKTPYFLANGQGPHFWFEGLGAVVSPLATPLQTNNNFTIAHITMRKSINGQGRPLNFGYHQLLYGMVGEVTVYLGRDLVTLAPGDALFIPAFTSFILKNEVNYSKLVVFVGGSAGIDSYMIAHGKPWSYSTPPAH